MSEENVENTGGQPSCPECRHIMPSGARCHASALRGKPFCYYHARERTLVVYNRCRIQTVALPPLEDRGAIQIAIDEVLAALTVRKINRETASTYLRAIQMASTNLRHAGAFVAQDPVRAVTKAPYGQEFAGEDLENENIDVSKFQTCLAELDDVATHEYEDDPPIEPVNEPRRRNK